MTYLDTSALVKKYVVETGSDQMVSLMSGDRGLFTSKLAYAEMCASLARKRREGGLERNHYRRALNSYLRDWETLIRIELVDGLFPLVRRLVETHPLRGADAVHLATAVWVRDETGEPVTFVAADTSLLAAAAAEGLSVLNPETA